MTYRVLDLFSGIGGFSLGLERTGGFKTVAFCEIDPFCRKVLAKHWPEVRQYEDVRTLTAYTLARDGIAVDVICGGFPCQPFSTASRGRRTAVDLWPEFQRVIAEVKPAIVLAENVAETPIYFAAVWLLRRGYNVFYGRIGADEIGADHKRDRWWFCAYPNDQGKLPRAINAKMAELPQVWGSVWGADNYARAVRIFDGLPNRVDRLKALGNAVVPQIPELIGNAILAADAERRAA